MKVVELSDEQRSLLLDTTCIVEAGPGAGKTRALIQRFLKSASTSPRGVALISFTNAAIDEARVRTSGVPHVLRAPHFVGTIDSFVHRFIVTPAEAQRLGHLPSYYASWDDLPSGRACNAVRVRSVRGAGVPLSCFRLDMDGAVHLDRAGRQERQYLASVESAGELSTLLDLAGARIRGLTRRGVYDASSARVRAYELLAGDQGPAIITRISRRFSDLLVDEAQDCDEAEIEIIKRLAAAGITTLIVADPDQAIFEFRGSKPQLFLELRDSYPRDACAQLSTNFRSTHAICRAVTSLRCACSGEINACEPGGDCLPVYVLSGTPSEQRDKFVNLLEENGFEVADAMVLSHALSDAEKVAGRTGAAGDSAAMGNHLASACSVLNRDDSSPMERRDAVRAVERSILRLIDWPEEVADASIEAKLQSLGLSREWLRQSAAVLVSGTVDAKDATAFGVNGRTVVQRILQSEQLDCSKIGSLLHKPSDDLWEQCVSMQDDRSPTLQCRSVHRAKGLEFAAVLVALPSRLRQVEGITVLDCWDQDENAEARRVLYVAASRAKQLLAFGAGPHASRVAGLLARDGVPLCQL